MQGPRPEYTFPARFIVRWLWSWARRRRRHLGEDGTWLVARHAAAPHVIAAERIPARDGFILVMNHYEPAGLRVWWPALSVSGAVGARRGEAPALRWLIADRFFQTRWHGVPIPDGVIAWAFRQLARTYGLIVVSRSDARARAIALRRAARAARPRGAPAPARRHA
ncbi:MAG: hypothetical protein O3B31_00605 [Chloroflexi bacterium]|nr:hypothetical protein [Chloroflexota bacterium]MQC27450.1 hypothetical protein [Chloroflexota bacterium]